MGADCDDGRHDRARSSKSAALCTSGGDGARHGGGAGSGVPFQGGRRAWRFVPASGSIDRLMTLAIQLSTMPVTIVVGV